MEEEAVFRGHQLDLTKVGGSKSEFPLQALSPFEAGITTSSVLARVRQKWVNTTPRRMLPVHRIDKTGCGANSRTLSPRTVSGVAVSW